MTATLTLPAVYRDNSHSAIVLSRDDKTITYIPLDSLALETARAGVFDAEWKPYTDYPVRRAAEVYLKAVAYRPSTAAQVREHLSAIVLNKALAYATFDSLASSINPKGITMAKTPKTSAATPFEALVKGKPGTPAKATKAPAKTGVPSKAAAPAKTPAKAAAPAKTPAKPAAPAKTPAKAAAPAKTPAKAAGARTRVDEDIKHRVGDLNRVKGGFLKEFVEKAQGLKTFTRTTLEAAYGGRSGSAENVKMGTYFPYCVARGIFEAV